MPSSSPDATEAVFAAIADTTRRGILSLLRGNDSVTAGNIATAFPAISRPAVSRHLRVLREADLVRASAIGREVHYRLNPAPLHEIQQQWLAAFEPMWDASLANLKRAAEANP